MHRIILHPTMVPAGADYARSHQSVFIIPKDAAGKLQRIGLAAKLESNA
jgi:hypothetical protein